MVRQQPEGLGPKAHAYSTAFDFDNTRWLIAYIITNVGSKRAVPASDPYSFPYLSGLEGNACELNTEAFYVLEGSITL